MAIAVGGGLAIAGAAMQAVTQNVLAEPYILGVSSGASAMVTLVYFIGGSLMYISYIVPLFAFLGAVLSLVLVYKIGMSSINSNSSRLVLAGMTVSVILNATSQFFISMMPNSNLIRSITMWMVGSLSGARWNNLLLPCIASGIGLIYFTLNARAYNSLSLGDETAISLGIDARKVKKHTIIAVSFLTVHFKDWLSLCVEASATKQGMLKVHAKINAKASALEITCGRMTFKSAVPTVPKVAVKTSPLPV